MQRILILCLAFLIACNPGKLTHRPPAKGHSYAAYYQYYLDGLDTTNASSLTKALRVFGPYFKHTDSLDADSGLLELEMFYGNLTSTLNTLHEAHAGDYDSLLIDFRKYPEEVRLSRRLLDYDSTLHVNGFCIDMQEGSSYVKQDRNILKKYCYPYVSPAGRDYLDEIATEIKQGFSDDGGLIISPQNLADRALFWEHFLEKYPQSLFIKKAQEMHRYYLTILVEGMDNTYVLEDDSTISTYFKEAYKQLNYAFPGSETNQLVQAYVQFIRKKDFNAADSLLRKYRKQELILDFDLEE